MGSNDHGAAAACIAKFSPALIYIWRGGGAARPHARTSSERAGQKCKKKTQSHWRGGGRGTELQPPPTAQTQQTDEKTNKKTKRNTKNKNVCFWRGAVYKFILALGEGQGDGAAAAANSTNATHKVKNKTKTKKHKKTKCAFLARAPPPHRPQNATSQTANLESSGFAYP